MKALLNKTERLADKASLFSANISAFILLALVVLTLADVIGRYFFSSPVVGTVELVEFGMAGIVFFAFPLMFMRSELIIVDLVPFFRRGYVGWILSLIFLAIIAYIAYVIGDRIYFYGIRAIEDGDVTEYLHIPRWPVVMIIAMALFIASIISALRFLVLLTQPGKSAEDLADNPNAGGENL